MKRLLFGLLVVFAFLPSASFSQTFIDVVKSSVTPTVTAASTNYSAGDSIGGKLSFTGVPNEGIIQSIQVVDEGAEAKSMELCLFDGDLAATVTDNGAFDADDADLLNLVGCSVVSDFGSFADNGRGQVTNIGLPYKADVNTLYGVLIDRAGGYYYDATDALTVTVTIYR